MKRFLYIALLLNFLILLGTGILRFYIPFSIEISRLHIVSGLACGVMILIHLWDKSRVLRAKIKPRGSWRGWNLTIVTLVACIALWLAALSGVPGISHLMSMSYEARNHASIFRSQDNVAHLTTGKLLRATKLSSTGASLDLELLWKQPTQGAAIAIWAETKSGTIIETLYLTGSLKYSEQHPWEGSVARRGEILPVWRHRYTAVCGVDPKGDEDLISRPTINHQWLLDQKLDEAKEGFVLFVEINLPNDGEPSIIFAANIEPDAPNAYTLLNLLGHSGGSQTDGELNYDVSTVPESHKNIERILTKTTWANK